FMRLLSYLLFSLSMFSYIYCLYFFFFFQAEDGIRDRNVTGVQTCALPICNTRVYSAVHFCLRRRIQQLHGALAVFKRRPAELHAATCGNRAENFLQSAGARSEERRVGKERRSRRTTYHSKKTNENTIASNA